MRQRVAERREQRSNDREQRIASLRERVEARRQDRSSNNEDRTNMSRQDRISALKDRVAARREGLSADRESRRNMSREDRIASLRQRVSDRRDALAEKREARANSRGNVINRTSNRSIERKIEIRPDGGRQVRTTRVLDTSLHANRRWRNNTRNVNRTYHREIETVRVLDRPSHVRHRYHNSHVFADYRGYWHHRLVWPSYRYVVSYGHGFHNRHHRYWGFRYVYPYYHRKYLFVSLGGYWPLDYSYARYYWYGCHPYYWYGYYPLPYEVEGDTHNYYTYNYYTEEADDSSGQSVNYIKPVDHNTFADVREKMAQEAAEGPAPETDADVYFEQAVKSFEGGDFAGAELAFRAAMEQSPEDMILPFAYSQTLFAQGKYNESAEALRKALAQTEPEKEGVFYPRGLYKDENVLFDQIEALNDVAAQSDELKGDLELLLGYHLLGIGETEAAITPLESASQDPKNADAAVVLLDLVVKRLEAEEAESDENAEQVD